MSLDIPEWIREVRQAVVSCSRIFLSTAAFEKTVRDLIAHRTSPIDAIRLHFPGADNLAARDIVVGDLGEHADHLDTITCHLTGEGNWECRISAHIKSNAGWFVDHRTDTIEELKSLADSFWKGQLRDDKSRLPALQGGQSIALAEATMHHALEAYGSISCLFCDLDNFKQVNDLISMAKGDDVIRQVAGIAHEIAFPNAIALHRSGDEFVLLLPSGSQNEALDLGLEIVNRIRSHDFDTVDISVGMSSGVAHITRDEGELSYQQFEQLAEKAVKLPDGTKLRGRATLRSPSERTNFPPQNMDTINRAICVIKGNPGNQSPFECPLLNVISRRVSAIVAKSAFAWHDVARDVQAFASHLPGDITPAILRSSEPSGDTWDGRPIVSQLDIALAAANGLFVAGLLATKEQIEHKTLTVKQEIGDQSSVSLLLEPDSHCLLNLPFQGEDATTIELGGFHYFNVTTDIDPNAGQRALLIKIGHGALGVPESVFAAVLVVDDRPTRGGELRDFWESVVARLIANVRNNPNIEKVYVFGDEQYAKETVRWLRSLNQWITELDYLSFKTGAKSSDIAATAQRLAGKIEFLAGQNALYERFANDLKDEAFMPPLQKVGELPADARFLRRELELGDVALTKHDGCRVSTIAKAFPIVVEIARTAEENDLIRDQAGQSLYELVDFKVHLTHPLESRIPAFYQREETSLNDYLQRAFLNENALFGKKIAEAGQLEAVLNHVAGAIRDPQKQFATRRGLLVLPNAVIPGTELSPLGLVSIRIVPRFSGLKTHLHYSFTWRTVEALVGFPYSIFGSVGYAEHLTKLIRQILGESRGRNVEMGQVSYLAHSLHIFRDDYGQHIARRIVDDASV